MFEQDGAGKSTRCTILSLRLQGSLAELATIPVQLVPRLGMVLDGCKLGRGSIRIFQRDMQEAVFRILQIDEAEAEEKFGFLFKALQYGAPPHGGLLFGLDGLVMLMSGTKYRDVIAFPETQTAHAC